jgi:hypothetical protein
MTEDLRSRLSELPSRWADPKLLADALSRAERGSPFDEHNVRRWDSFRDHLAKAIDL